MLMKLTRGLTKPLHAFLVSSVTVILLVQANAQTAASASGLDFYETQMQAVSNGFRNVFCPTLEPSARAICRSVRIDVQRSWGFGAFAVPSASGGYISITAGVAQTFDAIDGVRTLSNELTGGDDCYNAYMTHYLGVIQANQRRIRAGLDLRRTRTILEFAREKTLCARITPSSAVRVSRETAVDHSHGVESSLAFILLHELGHIVLGHTRADPSKLTLQERRAQEMAADNWALEAARRAGFQLGGSMAPAFIASINGTTIDWEEHSDHPLGVRRALNFYETIRRQYMTDPNLSRKLTESGNAGPVLRDLDRVIAKGRICLQRLEDGGNGC